MVELLLFTAFVIICPILYGRTTELGELRRCYESKNGLIKGEKQSIYYKYKKDYIWSSWRYYYIHITDTEIHLVPPLLYKLFMPKLKLNRNNISSSEYMRLIAFKYRTVYETRDCSVLIAFDVLYE